MVFLFNFILQLDRFHQQIFGNEAQYSISLLDSVHSLKSGGSQNGGELAGYFLFVALDFFLDDFFDEEPAHVYSLRVFHDGDDVIEQS